MKFRSNVRGYDVRPAIYGPYMRHPNNAMDRVNFWTCIGIAVLLFFW